MSIDAPTVPMTESYNLDPEDSATLAALGFQPGDDGLYCWTLEAFDEVIARLAIAAEDGDRNASDLAGFLMFVEASAQGTLKPYAVAS